MEKKHLLLVYLFLIISFSNFAQEKAVLFNGGQSYITVPHFPTTSTLTVEAWVKTTQTNTGTIVCWQNVIGPGDAVIFRVDGGKLQFGENISGWVSYTSTASVNTGNWTHLAVTRSGTTTKCYINGVLSAGSGTLHNTPLSNTNTLSFGAITSNFNESFVGQVDEIRIWNTVRTDQQIKDNYNKFLQGNETGLVGYWQFNSTLNDLTNNNRTGTFKNATYASSDLVDTPTLNSCSFVETTESSPCVSFNANQVGQVFWAILESDKASPSSNELTQKNILFPAQDSVVYTNKTTTQSFIFSKSLTVGTSYKLYAIIRTSFGIVSNVVSSQPFIYQGFIGQPVGWTSVNIGTLSVGNTSFLGNSIIVNSSGRDIDGASDSFHFAYKTIQGNFDIKTKISSQNNTSSWAKAGIMLRESLTPNSKMVFIELTPGNSANLQSRFQTGSTTYFAKALELTATATVPYWFRLVRKDSVVAGYCSKDGKKWTKIGYSSIRYKFANTLNVGLAVTSGNSSLTNTVVFDSTNFNVPALTDTIDNLGLFYSKKYYIPSKLPNFATDSTKLPDPIIDGNPGWRTLYYKAWKLAFSHILTPPSGSPLVSDWYDAAFSDNIFQWDMIFMSFFSRYADHIFHGIQSLDNFYCMQDKDGFIPRELSRYTGNTWVNKSSAQIINPPLFSWAEVQSYQLTGDKSRFAAVLPVLEKYFEWLELNRKCLNTPHLLYWNNPLGSGMDNTPRPSSNRNAWADMSCQMVLQCNNMATICQELGLAQKASYYKQKASLISANINKYMWNETDGMYYDVDANGNQVKVKTLGCFWAMLAGVSNAAQSAKMIANLKDPKTFWRPMIFPTLAADHSSYANNGSYWLGGVWAPTNYAVINGLTNVTDNAFAKIAAEKYIAGLYDVYLQTGTLWENYAPELINAKLRYGVDGGGSADCRKDFVGWTGLGPISMLIENVLGFRVDGANRRLCYDLRRLDRHGIKNLHINDITTSIECKPRTDSLATAYITVTSDKPYLLEIWRNGIIRSFDIPVGITQIVLENSSVNNLKPYKTVAGIKVFPNPVQNTLNIQSAYSINSISIYNEIQQCVYKKHLTTPTKDEKLDFSSFESGIYFVNIYTLAGNTTEKISKN